MLVLEVGRTFQQAKRLHKLLESVAGAQMTLQSVEGRLKARLGRHDTHAVGDKGAKIT